MTSFGQSYCLLPSAPWIIGSGRAGQAAAKSLANLALQQPELGIAPSRLLKRGEPLQRVVAESERPRLVIANPQGLHCVTLLAASQAGITNIVTEKPACVNLGEVAKLRGLPAQVAVLHVYRMMWGPQEIKRLLDAGHFGELITIEGRYWQASAAERVASGAKPTNSWKNQVELSGPFDTYLDVATHWVDMVSFLYGQIPEHIDAWRSYKNAEAAHRDSHVQLSLDFAGGGRGFGSISKTVHGAGNHFEINVLGTKGSATWTFLNPDEILLGEGRDRRIVTRTSTATGSRQMPFHGQGWLEGYTEILRQTVEEMVHERQGNYPKLEANLDMLTAMLKAEFR